MNTSAQPNPDHEIIDGRIIDKNTGEDLGPAPVVEEAADKVEINPDDVEVTEKTTDELEDILKAEGPGAIVEYNVVEAGLAALRDKYNKPAPDPTTEEGYKELKEGVSEMTKTRTGLEKIRKKIKQPALDYCNKIDTEANRIKGEIEKLEEPWKKVKKDHDEKEKRLKEEREAKAKAKIDAMRDAPVRAMNAESVEIARAILEDLRADRCEEGYYELTADALQVRKRSIEQIENIIKEKEDAAAAKAEIEERNRVDLLMNRLKSIEDMGVVTRRDNVQTVGARLKELKNLDVSEGAFQEYAGQAATAKLKAIEELEAELPEMEREAELLRKAAEQEEALQQHQNIAKESSKFDGLPVSDDEMVVVPETKVDNMRALAAQITGFVWVEACECVEEGINIRDVEMPAVLEKVLETFAPFADEADS